MPGGVELYTSSAEFILISIPIHIILAYLPLFMRYIGICRMKKIWDNANPRLYIASLENEALSGNELALFPLRAHYCHLNSMENLAFIIPAILAQIFFSGVKKLALSLCAIHLGLRFIYCILFMFFNVDCISYLRTLVWLCAWACPMIMLFEAAHHMNY